MAKILRTTIQSIRQNKLRSTLAGFGIAWGIFLLIIFLGIGNGFKNGVMSMFEVYAQKSLFVYGGQTSIATTQTNEDTKIIFDKDVITSIQRRYPCVIACSPEMSIAGITIGCAGESMIASLSGVDADYFRIKILKTKEGRTLNPADVYEERTVAVIGEGIRQALFGKGAAVGKYVDIGGSLFRVVGVLSSDDLFSVQERNSIYIPSSSFGANYDSSGEMVSFCLSLSPSVVSTEIEKDLKGYLAYKYGFDPHDENALYTANIETQTSNFEKLFSGLEVLIWVIGICLLLSGIVGVCNVMLIIVKERTSEIGIRKAVGATSGTIITMILSESIMITLFSGIIGAVLGTGLVVCGNEFILPRLNMELIHQLEFNPLAIIAAVIVLSLSGALAGLFPALKASQISPVEAIRYENRE